MTTTMLSETSEQQETPQPISMCRVPGCSAPLEHGLDLFCKLHWHRTTPKARKALFEAIMLCVDQSATVPATVPASPVFI